MTDPTDNCGYPDGVPHPHVDVCWRAGYRAGQAERQLPASPAVPVDPVAVFANLVLEVDAGRALVAMTPLGERHRAAADALALARDVLADARDMLGSCACGEHQLVPDDLGELHRVGGIVHAADACVSLDQVLDDELDGGRL